MCTVTETGCGKPPKRRTLHLSDRKKLFGGQRSRLLAKVGRAPPSIFLFRIDSFLAFVLVEIVVGVLVKLQGKQEKSHCHQATERCRRVHDGDLPLGGLPANGLLNDLSQLDPLIKCDGR